MELQGNDREGKASVFREVEGQGHVQGAAAARLGLAHLDGIELADHFGQALARLAAELLPEEELVVVELVNLGGSHAERGGLEDKLPDGVGPVGLLVRARQHDVTAGRVKAADAWDSHLGEGGPRKIALAGEHELDIGLSEGHGTSLVVESDGLDGERSMLKVHEAPES